MVVRRRDLGRARLVDTGCHCRSHIERKRCRRYYTVGFDIVNWAADLTVTRIRDQIAGDTTFISIAASLSRSQSASTIAIATAATAVAATGPANVCWIGTKDTVDDSSA